MVWHVQSAPAALWSLLKPLSSHWRHTKNDRTELSMPCFSACIWKQKDFRNYPLIQPCTLNSKLQQMALPGQLPAASITISFLFPWTQHHVKKTQKSTFQYYLCKYFSLWPVPKHTSMAVADVAVWKKKWIAHRAEKQAQLFLSVITLTSWQQRRHFLLPQI